MSTKNSTRLPQPAGREVAASFHGRHGAHVRWHVKARPDCEFCQAAVPIKASSPRCILDNGKSPCHFCRTVRRQQPAPKLETILSILEEIPGDTEELSWTIATRVGEEPDGARAEVMGMRTETEADRRYGQLLQEVPERYRYRLDDKVGEYLMKTAILTTGLDFVKRPSTRPLAVVRAA